jgi:hypothetical protein
MDNMSMTKDRNYHQARTDHPPKKTITYSDKAAPWSRSTYLMGTRLLPSRMTVTTSPKPHRTRTEIVIRLHLDQDCCKYLQVVFFVDRNFNLFG